MTRRAVRSCKRCAPAPTGSWCSIATAIRCSSASEWRRAALMQRRWSARYRGWPTRRREGALGDEAAIAQGHVVLVEGVHDRVAPQVAQFLLILGPHGQHQRVDLVLQVGDDAVIVPQPLFADD